MNEMVYVVDDDEAVRDSLRWLLEGNGFRVTCFESADRVLEQLTSGSSSQRACLILDVRMPGMTGIELHEELLKRGIVLPVIFITGHGNVPMAVDTMKKGAMDFLEKPFSDEQLCALVAKAFEQLKGDMEKTEDAKRSKVLLDRLTPREAQVLERIVAGRLNKQIADDLHISIKTVEAHRANIMDKIEARTMADLMKIALNAAVA
ncbi:MAG: response regulator transcription factor [Betaproteobacteria bacterium]|jgi:FixJ family two-component response regulator|nr:response regulator transcription factor [Betaproteobacteria bacterium]